MFNNKSILITGGTGSFGYEFVNFVVNNYKPKRLVVYSRDELKQYEMRQKFNVTDFNFLRYFCIFYNSICFLSNITKSL